MTSLAPSCFSIHAQTSLSLGSKAGQHLKDRGFDNPPPIAIYVLAFPLGAIQSRGIIIPSSSASSRLGSNMGRDLGRLRAAAMDTRPLARIGALTRRSSSDNSELTAQGVNQATRTGFVTAKVCAAVTHPCADGCRKIVLLLYGLRWAEEKKINKALSVWANLLWFSSGNLPILSNAPNSSFGVIQRSTCSIPCHVGSTI